MASILSLSNLTKKYGSFKAVDNLNLEIGEGEIYGFVGANGAGKTTTMRMIAGLMPPTLGTIIVNGINTSESPREYKRKIGYMPDFFGVYDDLKVDEYMRFYCGVYGIDSSLYQSITDSMLELVDLTDKRDAYVNNLSRGMKQRLCLARSMLHNPDLLILDEPASGLDPRARVEMKEILKTLRDMGKTVIISSHILTELSEMCTSIAIIDKGKLAISGTVGDVLKRIQGKQMLRINLKSSQETAERILKEQPWVIQLTIHSDFIDVEHTGEEEQRVALLKSLMLNDVPVLAFSELEGSLENAFMKVITEGVKENI